MSVQATVWRADVAPLGQMSDGVDPAQGAHTHRLEAVLHEELRNEVLRKVHTVTHRLKSDNVQASQDPGARRVGEELDLLRGDQGREGRDRGVRTWAGDHAGERILPVVDILDTCTTHREP